MQYEQTRYERSFRFLAVLMVGLALFWAAEVLAQTFNNPGGTSAVSTVASTSAGTGAPTADSLPRTCSAKIELSATPRSFRFARTRRLPGFRGTTRPAQQGFVTASNGSPALGRRCVPDGLTNRV